MIEGNIPCIKMTLSKLINLVDYKLDYKLIN